MGDDATIEILFFAIVAIFICHRLWLVLGRRNGEAPPSRPDPFGLQRQTAGRLDSPRVEPAPAAVPVFNPDDPLSLDGWIARLRTFDPGFNERSFLDGAKSAFRLITLAYAKGDRQALRPLLADDVHRIFERSISGREAAGEHLETAIDRLAASIDGVKLTGSTSRITVAFRSAQTNLLKASDGTVIHGDPRRFEDVTDIWTFARDTRSRDPNWTLIETRHEA